MKPSTCRNLVPAPWGTISEKSSSLGSRVTRGIVTEGAASQLCGAANVAAMANTQNAIRQHLGIIGILITAWDRDFRPLPWTRQKKNGHCRKRRGENGINGSCLYNLRGSRA